MDIQFIIDTIHERRADIDMIAMPFVEDTYYADSDAVEGAEGDASSGGFEIPRNR